MRPLVVVWRMGCDGLLCAALVGCGALLRPMLVVWRMECGGLLCAALVSCAICLCAAPVGLRKATAPNLRLRACERWCMPRAHFCSVVASEPRMERRRVTERRRACFWMATAAAC